MHHLMDELDQLDEAGRIDGEIVLVPVANPVGISQWRDTMLTGRTDFNTGINFNRNHLDLTEQVSGDIKDRLGQDPEANTTLIRASMLKALADMAPEDESAFLKHCLLSLACDADIVLDLHCDLQASVHIYMGTPLWPDAADLTAELGAEDYDSTSWYKGKPAIFVGVKQAPGANPLVGYLPTDAMFVVDYVGNPDWPGRELTDFMKEAMGEEMGAVIGTPSSGPVTVNRSTMR